MSTVVDFHLHIGDSLQGYKQSVEEALASMQRLAIDRAVLCPLRPHDYAYPPANDFVAETVRSQPGRFWGLGRVDPRRRDAALETERCLSQLGLKGVYLHPWEDTFAISEARVDAVMEACQQHGALVLIAAGYPLVSEAPQVADLARRFPKVTLVMTNGGQLNISGLGQRNVWLALQELSNLYITTSGTYREDFLEEVMTQIGAKRMLFGSQSPLYDQDFEIHRIRWAHVSQAMKLEVLGNNALRLLNGSS